MGNIAWNALRTSLQGDLIAYENQTAQCVINVVPVSTGCNSFLISEKLILKNCTFLKILFPSKKLVSVSWNFEVFA